MLEKNDETRMLLFDSLVENVVMYRAEMKTGEKNRVRKRAKNI